MDALRFDKDVSWKTDPDSTDEENEPILDDSANNELIDYERGESNDAKETDDKKTRGDRSTCRL